MNADSLFEQLEPPPAGAERFARRLDEATAAAVVPSWRPLAWAGAVGAIAIAAVAITVLVPRERNDAAPPVADSPPVPALYDSPAFDRLLGRPLQPAQLTAIVDEQSASITELESHNEKVRIYQLN